MRDLTDGEIVTVSGPDSVPYACHCGNRHFQVEASTRTWFRTHCTECHCIHEGLTGQ